MPQHIQSAVLCVLGAGQQQASNTAEGMASPRTLGRSSSAGMGSGESSGRGPTWSQMPRSHGQRVTARIPSWLHLPSLGQPSAWEYCLLDWLASFILSNFNVC